MKRINLLILLLCVFLIGWASDSGWKQDKSFTEVIHRQQFSISKTHVGIATSGDSVTLDTIPGNSILKAVIIDSDAPTATADGSSVVFAVGSTHNVALDTTLAGNEVDVLSKTSSLTTANIHGDLEADYGAQKFSTTYRDGHYWVTDDTVFYLNYTVTGDTSTTTSTGSVYFIYDTLQ